MKEKKKTYKNGFYYKVTLTFKLQELGIFFSVGRNITFMKELNSRKTEA